MGFTSQLYPGELIIDDGTPESVFMQAGMGRGLILDRPREGYAYAGTAEPFPQELLVPRSEWQARIQEMEERKTRASDLINQAGLPCHDQDGIPYCWIHGPTGAVEAQRVIQNQPMVLLSATSVGCKIKNFQSEGGWGKEGLEYIVKHGVVPQSLWPENQLKRQYDTPEAWEAAKSNIVIEWWELQPRNHDEMMSALFRRNMIAGGYNWWSHEIYNVDPVWLDGEGVIRIRNSWGMNWPTQGAGGWSILRGSKMLADDAVGPRVLMAA